jgi:hypothetical protein
MAILPIATRGNSVRIPIRNKGAKPLTVFIEPICDQYEVPVGGEAVVILEDGRPHSIDLFDDAWVSIWNEGVEQAIVEIRTTHASIEGR